MSTKQTTKQNVATDIQVADKKQEKQQINYRVRDELRQKGGIYFYSSAIMGKKNVFVTPEYMDLLVNAFRLAEIRNDVKNLAYVVMPNHFYWVFRLSQNQDDPLPVYKDVKKEVAFEILKNLREESKEDEKDYEMLDIFKDNDKVMRSNPRKILWIFKQEAKKLNKGQRYKVWAPKANLSLIKDDSFLKKSLSLIKDAPVRERWQLVEDAMSYPYLYIADEAKELLSA